MNHYVMDYETFKTCFVAVFRHYKTGQTKVFIISKFKNDIDTFCNFLLENIKNGEWHISFNGIAFDSQITQFILLNRDKLRALDGESIARRIHAKAQDVIARNIDPAASFILHVHRSPPAFVRLGFRVSA